MAELTQLSANLCFGGQQLRFQHFSTANQCDMTFSIFIPPQASDDSPRPALVWLSGLTCNDENFTQKAGAQKKAAELGLILVMPDTSPRGDHVPDADDQAWDLGKGAGFYVNATQVPWSQHYHMFDYINIELPKIIAAHFPWNGKASISGHSMGGHGALISAAHFSDQYASVSAFAPICHPVDCPWGKKAFHYYLGNDRNQWMHFDAVEQLKQNGVTLPTLVDQGDADQFLEEQLGFNHLQTIAETNPQQLQANLRKGYDHSYFFIASFIDAHLDFHFQHLNR